MTMEYQHLQLWCDSVLVGDVPRAWESVDTWYGTVELRIREEEGALQQRILEFIALCEDFNARCANGGAPSASEFDAYADVIRTGRWRAQGGDGRVDLIQDAPVFSVGGEVSWIVLKT